VQLVQHWWVTAAKIDMATTSSQRSTCASRLHKCIIARGKALYGGARF
jgi:hypothetical protein